MNGWNLLIYWVKSTVKLPTTLWLPAACYEMKRGQFCDIKGRIKKSKKHRFLNLPTWHILIPSALTTYKTRFLWVKHHLGNLFTVLVILFVCVICWLQLLIMCQRVNYVALTSLPGPSSRISGLRKGTSSEHRPQLSSEAGFRSLVWGSLIVYQMMCILPTPVSLPRSF